MKWRGGCGLTMPSLLHVTMDDELFRDILQALNPAPLSSHGDPSDNQHVERSLRRCLCCRGIVQYFHECNCACGVCIYCSEKCQREDSSQHQARCDDIVKAMKRIYKKFILFAERGRSNIEEFVGPYGRGHFDTLSVYGMGEGSESCWKDYFLLRQQLIEELIMEGIARTDGNGKMKQNEVALNTAIYHCQQLFTIDKDDSYYSHVVGLIPRKETLMNLYLFTGRYQELYDLCCFYVRKGEHTIHTPYRQGFDLLGTRDISKSFFDGNMRQIPENMLQIHHASFPAVALTHMYLLKQVMHEIMKVLIWADKQFLSSHDCVQLIGEFLGLDREWISYKGGSYNNQALEIMQIFVGCKTTNLASFMVILNCFSISVTFNKLSSSQIPQTFLQRKENAAFFQGQMQNYGKRRWIAT
jgi:hypothetical protein